MKNETSYPVWEQVLSSISSIRTLIDNDQKLKSKLNNIMRHVLSEIKKIRLGMFTR